jgi:hypothetical protein
MLSSHHRTKELTVAMIQDDVRPERELVDTIRANPQRHPALARLRADLIASTSTTSRAITSYDRQHHRHNRS